MKTLQLHRVFSILLICAMVLTLAQPLSVWATTTDTVYLDPANGTDTNAGTEAAPVKTLAAAYGKLTGAGTIVFLSDLQITGNTFFPVCQYPVTLTSKTGAEGIVTTGTLRMQGDTTFKDITVTFNASGLAFISGEGNDLTIDTGVTTVNLTGNQVNLVATKRFDATLTANPTLTVRSGKWDYIYATHGNSITGSVTVNIEGGICTTFSPSYNATVTGNVNVSVKNASVSTLMLEPTHSNGKITGKLHICLDDGADVGKATGSSGAVQGGTTLEVVGNTANTGTLTGYGVGSDLLLSSGTWNGVAEDFDSVAIDVAAGEKVTLSSPVTADTVNVNGTLDFNGVGSLNAKTVTGTVNCTITGRVLKNNLYVSAPANADIRFPAEYGMVNTDGNYLIHDLVNFEGLAVKAEKGVKITFYSDPLNNNTTYKAKKDYVIAPYATEEKDGFVYYYLPNITGLYCYEASKTGYYTIFQQICMTAEEAATYTEMQVLMEQRGEGWDNSYYFAQTDEILDAQEKPTDKWQTQIPLESPVFTNTDKPAHQMSTQDELEAFIQNLDDAADNMYIYSIGKSVKYGFDIPIVFFTKSDLSGCTTLEQVADKLKKDGLPNIGYKAQMHGDEHAAGEGALNVIKLLDKDESNYLLDSVNIFVIPRMNPDGAYECQRNLRTPSIIDPEASSNTDPNRDMIVLNLVEQRYYLKTVQLFDPIAEIDGHERNRNSNTGDMQIGTGWQWGTSQDLLDVQVELVQKMFTALENVDLSGAWYSDFVNTDGIDQTRGFAANQGRMQVLIETRGIYLGNDCYGSRTASHIVTVMEYMAFCAENAQRIKAIVEAEQKRIAEDGAIYNTDDTITLTWKYVADSRYDVQTDLYNMTTGGQVSTQKAMFYVANKTRVAPTAYVVPANLAKIEKILELMDLQEIPYYFLPANTAISLQQYSGSVNADRQGTDITLSAEQYYTFSSGAYVFQMDHSNAKILAYMAEPDSPSEADLVEQGRITLNSDGTFPLYRYVHDLQDGKIEYVENPTGSLTTVYVSASGSDSNTGAEDAPVATLEKAYDLLTGALGNSTTVPGTIILLDDYTIESGVRVDLPAHSFPVKILGKTASVKLIFKPTAIGESLQQLAFHGPTTLDNLVFRNESTSKLDYIFACGNPFTVGRGVTTSAVSSLPTLVGGDYRTAAVDTDLTILGGKWYAVYVGSFREGHTGTAKLTVDGAVIQNNIRGKYEKATTGDFEIDLKNTTFKGVYPGYTGDVSGATTITLGENAEGAVYTNNGSSGNITGTVSVVIDGADLSKITFGNTSGTVTKDVLVFASGTATPVAGFSETQIGTETMVTLGADLAVDKISGGGVVELGSYKLTGSGAVSAEVKSVSLRPGAAGLYFTGDFQVSAGATYGIALSTEDETPVAEDNTTSLYTTGYNSVLLKDIMKAGSSDNKENANLPVYARAYVKLSDGTVIYGAEVQVTLRQVVYAVDAMWDTLTAAQQDALQAMYETFKADMAAWQIPNIKKA